MAKLAQLSRRIKAGGLATRTTARDRTRSVRRRAHSIAAWLRRRNDEAKAEVKVITAEMATIAEAAAAEARHLAINARRALRRAGQAASGKAAALVAELEHTAEAVERIAAQTRVRLAGVVPDGSTRVVSLHDPDARPIAKGRLGRPVEFGFKAQVVDNVDGIVLDHTVVMGNPPDAPMLVRAVARIVARFGKVPRAVTADRGYGEAAIDAGLVALGVKKVVIPRKGRPGAARREVQGRRGFRTLVKWRTGSEARISSLKRDHGWRRSLMDGIDGAETWCGWGVLANNATKISGLVAAKAAPVTPERAAEAPTHPGGALPGRRRAPAA